MNILNAVSMLIALFALLVAAYVFLGSSRKDWWPEFWQAVEKVENNNIGISKAGWIYLEQVIGEIPRMKSGDNWLGNGRSGNVTAALTAAHEVLYELKENKNHDGWDKCAEELKRVSTSLEVSNWQENLNRGNETFKKDRDDIIDRIKTELPSPSQGPTGASRPLPLADGPAVPDELRRACAGGLCGHCQQCRASQGPTA